MTPKERAAMQQALEALEIARIHDVDGFHPIYDRADTALREALDHSGEANEMVKCACGDLYPADSFGAGFISATGRCQNCDAAEQAEQEPVAEALQIASVALQDIACSSQTENLYWWQLLARKAQKQIAECLTNAAPVEPAKQEPVARVASEHTHSKYASIEVLVDHRLPCNTKLYAAPVQPVSQELCVECGRPTMGAESKCNDCHSMDDTAPQPVKQEPVAWIDLNDQEKWSAYCRHMPPSDDRKYIFDAGMSAGIKLFKEKNAAPVRTKDPCNPLQDLTDDEIMKINVDTASIVPTCDRQFHFARAVIAAYKEKNRG